MKYFPHIQILLLFTAIISIAQIVNAQSITQAGFKQTDSVFNQLVWSDEFDVDGAVNSDKWFHQTQLPSGGNWYNGEIQHYTNRNDNSFVENGTLKIVAKKETFLDQGQTKQYTSARLNSKFAFKYGRIEIRAKLPSGSGTWPAIWMLGKNINEDGGYWDNLGFGTTPWPACGEIDIMEHWGSNQNYVQSATHTTSSYGNTTNLGGQHIGTASTEFHIYKLTWTNEKLVFSVDGIEHFTYNPSTKNADTWPFDSEQYLLLNIAILPNISPSFTNGVMEIDYIRIYQEESTSSIDIAANTVTKVYPNPFTNSLNIHLEKTSEKYVSLRLYDLTGKLINTYSASVQNNKITLNNLGNLPKGLYLIKFALDKKDYSLKISKN